jgi:hypothetical protein
VNGSIVLALEYVIDYYEAIQWQLTACPYHICSPSGDRRKLAKIRQEFRGGWVSNRIFFSLDTRLPECSGADRMPYGTRKDGSLLEQGLQVKKKSKIDFFFSARAPYLSP